MTNTQPRFRITDIRTITLNGEPRIGFTAYARKNDIVYIHLGQFTAPVGTPEHALFGYIQLHGNDESEEA